MRLDVARAMIAGRFFCWWSSEWLKTLPEMDWRKFFNALLLIILLGGLACYRYSEDLPAYLAERGFAVGAENMASLRWFMPLLFAIAFGPIFVIWAILIFLDERDMLPEWRWPWQRRKHLEGTSRGGGSLDHLLTLCAGDREQTERLIQFELKRDSMLKRNQAIQKAADRLQYDRSR